MRAFISLFLSVCISLILVSCTHDEPSVNAHTETQSATVPLDTSAPSKAESSAQACHVIPTFFTLEEYEAYLDCFVELSPDFIPFKVFEKCGIFSSFRDLTDRDEYGFTNQEGVWMTIGNCNTYRYDLIDVAGHTIYIHISPASNYTDRFTSARTIADSQNLLKETKENGDYKYKNILYGFKNGKLVQMLVPYEKSMLSIRRPDFEPFEPTFSENDSFISRLVNTETAELALTEFNAKVAQARQEAQAEKAD